MEENKEIIEEVVNTTITKEQNFNEEEFLKRVEEAAQKGASKAKVRTKGNLLDWLKFAQPILTALILVALVLGIANGPSPWEKLKQKFIEATTLDSANNHDLVLDNNGWFGFTAADFADAVLGDASQLKKIEVYQREVSDVATLTNAGLFGWGVWSKSQVITYHGTAVYTVDLTRLNASCFSLDRDSKTVILSVPMVQMESINIDEKKIEYADPEKGLLSFGDMSVTPEMMSEIQAEARKKMEQKLIEENVYAEAERFAKMTLWETYQPIINSLTNGYYLDIRFK